MDLLNTIVIHKSLGKGTVIAQDDKHISVMFASKTCSFQYPEAFRNFLTAGDADNNAKILAEIATNDTRIMGERQRAEKLRRAEEEKRLEELAQKAKYKSSDKKVKRTNREDGKNMTFLVFQGNTFEAEYKGGFIWAPKYNQGGGTCHHWDKLLDVRKGDLIIHCADGYIQAISVAKGACYDAESPRELSEEQLWAKDGRMIDCEYIKLIKPIKHSQYKEIILKYCNVKYAPFDKDGNGNMGYLFDLNRELARFFVENAIVENGYLLDAESVQDLVK